MIKLHGGKVNKIIYFQMLILTARVKFQGNQVVLEVDGTVIDEDEVIMALDKNTVLMALKEDESWTPVSQPTAGINVVETIAKGYNNLRSATTSDGLIRLEMVG